MSTINSSGTSKISGGNEQNTASGTVENATELAHTAVEKAQNKVTPPPEPGKPDAKATVVLMVPYRSLPRNCMVRSFFLSPKNCLRF